MDGAGAPRRLWASLAWVDGRWREKVLLEVDRDGCWSAIAADTAFNSDMQRLSGPVLPGIVNAHSHAFQRGFAGLTEQRVHAQDDFWSWREEMYSLALRVTPDQLRAIASLLYSELLAGGYTQVCEFHYLHRDINGEPYADPTCMSRVLAQAAVEAGIGLTLLPVLYERAGFAAPELATRQRRFRSTVAEVLHIRDEVRSWRLPNVSAGVAIHSLRAASDASMRTLAAACENDDGPIHIHVAEQQAEVRDCLAATGERPIAWLAHHLPVDSRWHLVHATHADACDMDTLASKGAGVVVCPSTEADLGDGRFALEDWSVRQVPLSIGSDSHMCRNWLQELRLLEYGQRLALERRNVAADPRNAIPSTGEAMLHQALVGGAGAAGLDSAHWGLRRGARADCLVLDPHAGGLLGVGPRHLIDAAIFACDAPPIAEVWVAGERRVSNGLHTQHAQLRERFTETMQGLR